MNDNLELELVRAWRRYAEHLAGKHNQKSHGNKYGSADDIRANVKRLGKDKEALKRMSKKFKGRHDGALKDAVRQEQANKSMRKKTAKREANINTRSRINLVEDWNSDQASAKKRVKNLIKSGGGSQLEIDAALGIVERMSRVAKEMTRRNDGAARALTNRVNDFNRVLRLMNNRKKIDGDTIDRLNLSE